ncbi:DnaB helicase C-terminal domain-containing protein [Nostoc sp. FACHB-892]|uniref:DnaB helicase C-terminal domain-containing protein n=1 Tax=Nostoc sp. FACHB-892 TaxID=2692843 RepID=UPI001F54C531|nr:DnaB helicase C-terminal domain-containing protein [Nostoc sp. FACHB-892]
MNVARFSQHKTWALNFFKSWRWETWQVTELVGTTSKTSSVAFYPSSLVVVAAESHMGKTHFMISYAYEIMTKLGLPVLYVTPEMDKNQLNARMLARITGVDASMIQTNTQCYCEQIAQGIVQMVELP